MKNKIIMKTKKVLFLAAMVVGASMIFNSCKKEEGTPLSNSSIVGTWTGTDMKFEGQSLWSALEACQKDNKWIFKAGTTLVFDEGATKCDPDDPQTEEGKYEIIEDGDGIIVDDEVWEIIELNSTSLILALEEDLVTIEMHFRR